MFSFPLQLRHNPAGESEYKRTHCVGSSCRGLLAIISCCNWLRRRRTKPVQSCRFSDAIHGGNSQLSHRKWPATATSFRLSRTPFCKVISSKYATSSKINNCQRLSTKSSTTLSLPARKSMMDKLAPPHSGSKYWTRFWPMIRKACTKWSAPTHASFCCTQPGKRHAPSSKQPRSSS